MLRLSIVVCAVFLQGCILPQLKKKKKVSKAPVAVLPVPPANPNAINKPPAAGPKPYKQVITDKAVTDIGLFKVHRVDEKYFFEIPDSLLGRDILIVNRISKAAAGVRSGMAGYAGDQIGENVVRFEKGPSNRIFIKSMSFAERASDTTGMYTSVMNSSLQPLVAAFDVKAYGQDSIKKAKSSVIDVQDYLNGDNDVFFFDASVKRMLSLGTIITDRSYISGIRSFPSNIEIRTVKTYVKSVLGQPPAGPVTFELNSSMVLLPEKPMKPRFYDPRVGYFSTGYVDYDANPQGIKRIQMITRWRLEPRPEDVEKYKKGELVEPQKPIVFYIDPATPKKWVPYLIKGVNDWQVAFEKAGFKNAIIAKEAPKDPNWSIDDARHNAIVYKPSDIPNASGPHVNDPRSGEIIETHINWYHNVMSLVHNWYLIQASATDPRARKMTFDDDLMGQLIRFVSSHEVGHTLGLRHNFGASSTVPVANLRNRKWLEEHGHTPSIMDYARFNYVAQPEDNINEKGMMPHIGEYDKWAIEWGYKWMPEFATAQEETPALNKWIIERLAANKRLWFGTEMDAFDPRAQSEDLGDNAVLAGTYGIKNLKRIVPNIISWTNQPNEDYSNARATYNDLVNQFNRYIGHAARNIGGTYSTPRTVEEKAALFEDVPYARQKDAVAFINREIFTTPTWLINKNLISYAGVDPVNTIRNIQASTLSRLLNVAVLNRMLTAEGLNPGKSYTADNLFTDLKKGIWTELYSHSQIDIYRRNLQRMYVENLSALVESSAVSVPNLSRAPTASDTDISALVRAHLNDLKLDVSKAIPSATGLSKAHLKDVLFRINSALEPPRK